MALVVVSNGKISTSILTPKHDATVHEHSAVVGEMYSTYFPTNEVHSSTLAGLGTKTEAGGVVTVGTGAGIGSSRFVKATTFTPSTTMAVFRWKIASITNGAGNYRMSHIGLTDNFTTDDPENVEYIGFLQDNTNAWGIACGTGVNYETMSLSSDVAVGDILTIAVSKTAVYFYVNDILVFTPQPSSIPQGALSVGFSVVGTNVPTSTRELGIVYYSSTVAASAVSNTPAGTISATTVQAAINELDTEKLPLAGGTMTGVLAMGANAITTSSTVDGVDVSAIPTTYLPLGGGTMTGALAMGANAITTSSTVDGVDISAFKLTQQNVSVLTPGATISLDPTLASVFTLTPDQACTINMASHVAGQVFNVIFTSTGTSRVVTYGTGFKGSASTTVAGSAGDKYITQWVDDGTDAIYRGSGGPF